MKRRIASSVICSIFLAAALIGAREGASGVQSALGVRPAQASVSAGATIRGRWPNQTVSDVVASFEATSSATHSAVGFTAADLAATHALYAFGSSARGFTAGRTAFETPLAAGGFCVTFTAATSCTHVLPSAAEPLIGVGYDPDSERSGEPFVVISIKAPTVRSVAYNCAGTSYAAHILGRVVAFVAPSSALSLDDCSE
jgi:hypothetical protein